MAATDLKLISKKFDAVNDFFVKFVFMKIGRHCNGDVSNSFTNAACDMYSIRWTDRTGLCLKLEDLFKKGFTLLRSLRAKETRFDNKDADSQAALRILSDFFQHENTHRAALKKVFAEVEETKRKKKTKILSDDTKATETDITVAIAEHLLGKLSPSQEYIIDDRSKKKCQCKCGCRALPAFGPTGIGHEEVWHGFIDITLESYEHDEGASISVVTTLPQTAGIDSLPLNKKRRFGDDSDEENDSDSTPEGKLILKDEIENQTVAQTIIFSLLQKKRHPDLKNFFVPNIVISPTHFRILMYDSKNDILVRSQRIAIFTGSGIYDEIDKAAIIILWMVLHYRLFCCGIDFNALEDDISSDDIKAQFEKVLSSRPDIYIDQLKSCADHFPVVSSEKIISDDRYAFGTRIYKPDV